MQSVHGSINSTLQICFKTISKMMNTCGNKVPDESDSMQVNYLVSKYTVETKDGYLLSLVKVTNVDNNENKHRQQIFIQHGILDSHESWIYISHKSLVYALVDNGYDVWLGNSRGNRFSRKHRTLDPDKNSDFWNFSFEEMGKYDIPAFLDYIYYQMTYREKIIVIAHSQGTSSVFSGLVSYEDYYKSRVKLYIALTPAIKNSNVRSKFVKFLCNSNIEKGLELLGIQEIGSNNADLTNVLTKITTNVPELTKLVLALVVDANYYKKDNTEEVNKLMKLIPCGSSLKSFVHFKQLTNTNRFARYDYGRRKNLEIYKSEDPPEYDLGRIKNVPIALFFGDDDLLIGHQDGKLIENKLSTLIFSRNYPKIGHLGFHYCDDKTWLEDLLDLCELYC